MLVWTVRHPAVDLGFLPLIFLENDLRPAKEQAAERYRHGGGWHPLEGWVFSRTNEEIVYPGDPPLRPLAWVTLRLELILLYESSWVCILQPDGSYEVARMD